jgi:hypothetical protein
MGAAIVQEILHGWFLTSNIERPTSNDEYGYFH